MTASTTIPMPGNPGKDAREEARWRRGDYPDIMNTCICCGRKATRSHYVAMEGMGLIPIAEGLTRDDNSFMGFYPVGSTCRRLLPQGYVITKRAMRAACGDDSSW